jgi:flagellar hook assembly protein FlgD
LSPGKHRVTITAWDTYNNPASTTLEFVVTQSISLRNVTNVPNPFIESTVFRYEHDRPNEELEIEVTIYTVTGALVSKLKTTTEQRFGGTGEIIWDGTGKDGKKLEAGVYVYRLSVRSKADNVSTTYGSRLVLIR